jgi:hypothetical protein
LDGSGEGGCLFFTVVFCDDFGDSEVTDLDVSFMNEDVFGFDVPVNDTVLFEELQGYDGLGDESLEYSFVEIFLLVKNKILESSFIAVLED